MLTERQEEILDFLRDYQQVQGVPPSTREIARRFGLSQPTSLKHLRALAAKGRIEKLADGRWGLNAGAVQMHLFDVPVYGAIPAGLPAMQEQEPEERVRIDPSVFGLRPPRPHHFWLLRVSGDSMTGARIFDGDLVALIRREPRPGDIIAALVDETTTTLKRLVRERGRLLLRAENPRYADIVPQRLESQGVVVGVIRRQPA
ncbi:MAG TPA: transcriptional repressor LexA [Candidatus Didemnitutus sp.]|jgi:repressor LexA